MARVIKDSGWSREIKQLLERVTVTVGIHEQDASRKIDDGLSNAVLGFWHEYGTSRAPQRSFLRSTYDRKEDEYRRFFKAAMARAARRGKRIRALDLVGMKIAADVKETIRAHIPPPNAPETIAKKGSSTPLIDSGELLNSIDYQVSE